MKNKIIYIVGFLLLIVLSGIGGYIIGSSKEPKLIKSVLYETKTEYDTLLTTELKAKLKATLSTIAKLEKKLKTEKDTIILFASTDTTLPEEGLIAVAETSLVHTEDVDTAKLDITYYFPPVNEFDVKLKLSQRIKFVDTTFASYEKTFWDNFGILLGYGGGYDFDKKSFYHGAQITVGYKIK